MYSAAIAFGSMGKLTFGAGANGFELAEYGFASAAASGAVVVSLAFCRLRTWTVAGTWVRTLCRLPCLSYWEAMSTSSCCRLSLAGP